MRNKSRKTEEILYKEIGSNAELERAEEALVERENRLRTILETAPQCVKLIDRDGTLLEMNPAGLAIIEADGPEQVIGKNVLGVVNTPYRPAIDALLADVFCGKTGRVEYEITGLKGTRRWLEINAVPLRNKSGEITAFLGITNEITERKRAEEALRESEERYRTLFETAPDPILVFNLNRIITMVNQSGVAMYGVEGAEELIGKNVYELLIPEDRPRALANAKELLRTGSARNIEYTALKKDGNYFFVEYSASVVTDGEGKPKAIIGVSKDITRHKRAEEELKVSHEQLRALSARIQSLREEERTQIAREIHDELGQALTALKMDLSWMQKRLPVTADGMAPQPVLEKIKSMQGLIDTTIQSVRKISTELRPVVLDQLGLAAAIEWQAEEFQARSEIRCDVSLYSENIALDQARSTTIFRVFQEILTNVARHANATEVKISLKEDTGNLILEVRDNGKGIAKSDISNIKSLGLLGMRERTLLLGGEFTISGEPQKGTTVVLRVPLSQ
jgi:PAS domain S-box-containing protein